MRFELKPTACKARTQPQTYEPLMNMALLQTIMLLILLFLGNPTIQCSGNFVLKNRTNGSCRWPFSYLNESLWLLRLNLRSQQWNRTNEERRAVQRAWLIATNSCYILLKRHEQGVGSFQKLRYHLGWEILETQQFFYNDIFHQIGSLEEWNKGKLNNSYVIY